MYIVKELRQEELLRLLLAGYKLKEAAAYMKVTPWTVRNYLQSEGFMERLRERNESVWREVDAELQDSKVAIVVRAEEAAQAALEEMIHLVKESKNEGIKFKAAQDLMDRNPNISRTKRLEGGAAPQGPNILNAVVLQQIVGAMKEEAQSEGLVSSGLVSKVPSINISAIEAEGEKVCTEQLELF